MKEFELPTQRECLDIIEQCRVPTHISKHSKAVAQLAVFLAHRLKEKGIAVNVPLVHCAGLLHDIMRVCDFSQLEHGRFENSVTEKDKAKWKRLRAKYEGLSHEEAAYALLKKEYPVLASTIKKHKYTAMLHKRTRPNTWEEKLLYYADMRVMHDEIVPLKTRLNDAHKRNIHLHATQHRPKTDTDKVDGLIHKLEEEIFSKTGLNPTEITDKFIDSYSKRKVQSTCQDKKAKR